MFCSKCGAQIPDGSKFCPNCGNVMMDNNAPDMAFNPAHGYAAPVGAYAAPKPVKKKSKAGLVIGIIAGVVAIAAVVTLLVVNPFGKPYEKPIKNMFKALNTNDYSLLSNSTTGDVYDDLSYNIEYSLEEGVSPDYQYTIADARRLGGDELNSAKGEYGGTQFYAVTMTITFYDPYWEESDSESGTVLVGKIGGKWVVCDVDYWY